MVSFARAKTKTLLSRLWPVSAEKVNNQTDELEKSKYLVEDIEKQNKCLLEAIKNGGIWFS